MAQSNGYWELIHSWHGDCQVCYVSHYHSVLSLECHISTVFRPEVCSGRNHLAGWDPVNPVNPVSEPCLEMLGVPKTRGCCKYTVNKSCPWVFCSNYNLRKCMSCVHLDMHLCIMWVLHHPPFITIKKWVVCSPSKKGVVYGIVIPTL